MSIEISCCAQFPRSRSPRWMKLSWSWKVNRVHRCRLSASERFCVCGFVQVSRPRLFWVIRHAPYPAMFTSLQCNRIDYLGTKSEATHSSPGHAGGGGGKSRSSCLGGAGVKGTFMHVGHVVAKRASPQLHNRATAVLGPAHLLTFRNNVEFLFSRGKCQARKPSIFSAWPSCSGRARAHLGKRTDGRQMNRGSTKVRAVGAATPYNERASKCDPIERKPCVVVAHCRDPYRARRFQHETDEVEEPE